MWQPVLAIIVYDLGQHYPVRSVHRTITNRSMQFGTHLESLWSHLFSVTVFSSVLFGKYGQHNKKEDYSIV